MRIYHFTPLFYRLRDKHGSLESVNNTKGDVNRNPDIYNKPANNYVAQLRANVTHNPVSKKDFRWCRLLLRNFPFPPINKLYTANALCECILVINRIDYIAESIKID